jgi:hypothetical protein
MPEANSQVPYEEKSVKEEKLYQRLDGDFVVVKSVADRLEAFADAMNAPTPPSTPPPSNKGQAYISDSELSEAKSMESIEFDESFSSAANSVTPAPALGAQTSSARIESSPGMPVPASPGSSPCKQESISSSSSSGSSKSQRALSRTRKTCMHCGTIATLAWRNGPVSMRNRCQNSSCNKPRDH